MFGPSGPDHEQGPRQFRARGWGPSSEVRVWTGFAAGPEGERVAPNIRARGAAPLFRLEFGRVFNLSVGRAGFLRHSGARRDPAPTTRVGSRFRVWPVNERESSDFSGARKAPAPTRQVWMARPTGPVQAARWGSSGIRARGRAPLLSSATPAGLDTSMCAATHSKPRILVVDPLT